ncbi:hypothetical protein CALVIDRAFT_331887 [Calocera viscosa TUFC12733]|uniref:Uncharacterized protein n=1 Tax=Calocera viscosa (strain TUFC12733) TaxID=1330018 RepID=A0A167HTB1_CALVF|nr:hypothetical protein CALVIDRAFT_331887 [Calocera viscosa TUFC12733]
MTDVLSAINDVTMNSRHIKRRRLASYDLNIPPTTQQPSPTQSLSDFKGPSLACHDTIICHCCHRSLTVSSTYNDGWLPCSICQRSTCNVCCRTCTMPASSTAPVGDCPLSTTPSPRHVLKQLSRVLAGQRPSKARRRRREEADDDDELEGCHRQICRRCIGKESLHYSTCVECLIAPS